MSFEKAVPTFLRHNEVERGGYGQNAPIRYAPEQEMKSDVSDVTNSISLPGKTKTYLKVWNGKGSNESFLDFVMTSLGLIKRLGYWKKLEEADESVLEAEDSMKESKTAYKDAKEKVQKATTSDDEEADREKQQANLVLFANRDDAKQAYQVAQAELETAQESRNDVAEKPFDFYGSNLSTTEQTSWGKIVTGFTDTSPFTDIFGKVKEASPGKTRTSFMDCIQMHLQTRFAYNAAENQRLYVMCGLKKSPKVTMRQFCERVATLNDAIDFLPMRFYSPKATEHTTKCEKYDDMTMVGNIMRTLPESWQNDLLKSVQGVTPETTRELLPLLELLERSPPSGVTTPIPKKEKAADVSLSGSKRRGGSHGGAGSRGDKRKKGNLTLNRCKNCEKHGGPAHTHATEKCYKYNLDGTPKSVQAGKDRKAHKAFATMQSKVDKQNKKLDRLLKKQRRKDNKRSRRARYESSDSDSDSS